MIDTELEISCAVFFRRMNKPSEDKYQAGGKSAALKRMRAEYSVPSIDLPCFVLKYKAVPDHSCVNQAVLAAGVVSGVENW